MRTGLLVLAALLAALAGSPARAELRDVAAAASGETGHVWLVFDETPAAVDAVMTATGLQLEIDGVSVRQRVITPFDMSVISSITVMPAGTGARIGIDGRVGWNSARAEIVEGAVLVTIGLPATAVRVDGERVSGGDAPPADVQTAAAVPAARPTGSEDVAPAAADRSVSPENDAAGSDPSAGPSVAAGAVCPEEAAAVAASPWDDDSLHAHAACLVRADALASAAQIYEQMLAFAPENFRALIALAELRERQGNDAAARELYSQAANHALSDAEAARARFRLRELQEN
jgi:hypothetical protein